MLHVRPQWIILVLAFFGTMLSAADPAVVWQIGKPDQNYREFANADNVFGGYAKAFPQDIRYAIGKSDPAKDFSPVHPGPIDAWAGSREHPFAITFPAPPATAAGYELSIDLVDTQSAFAPLLRVAINDQATQMQLEPGVGDFVIMNPEKGKHRSLKFLVAAGDLKPQDNVLTLTVLQGSWILYDAITLRKLDPEHVPALTAKVEPTIFMVEKHGQLLQEFVVNVSPLLAAEQPRLEVKIGGQTLATRALKRPSFGQTGDRIQLPITDAPRELAVTISAGQQVATVQVAQKPLRKWRIYCAPSTHTDIGYTAIQSQVIQLHNRNTDLALEMSAQFPLYHWNLESSWAAQMWLRDVSPHRHNELYEAARQSRVGVETSYLNMLTGLCSDEELIRTLYYSARLHREHGVPFTSYTLTDAPSHVWSLPTVLAGAGIRCVSIGSNQTRAPILRENIHLKAPFWWEGPDGARILTWITAGYSQAGEIGLRDGLAGMQAAIDRKLIWWNQREDYPYDALLLHGAYSDNVAIAHDIAESITAYSRVYAYPKVILCSNDVFFKYIEENFADRIPTVRGDGGSWWEDGAGSTAVETGINRLAHAIAIAAEAAWAVAKGVDNAVAPPQDQFNALWDNILLYDEHTWGAHNSITEPTSDFVTRQWAVKAAYATEAADAAGRLLDNGLRALAARVQAPDDALLVFNPTGRTRSGYVEAVISRKSAILGENGQPLPAQVIGRDVLDKVTVLFRAQDVPATGYRCFALQTQEEPAKLPTRLAGTVLENKFYKVVFDTAAGGISSLLDKTTNRELVDAASQYKLGQLVYAAGGKCEGNFFVDCPNRAEVKVEAAPGVELKPGATGPVYASARLISQQSQFRRIEMEVLLYEHEPRVDFHFKLNKKMVFEKEAVYLAFPFAGDQPQFRYEIGAGNVRPNEDQWPGGCRDWFSVQRWITVSSAQSAVAWSPIDTPLVTLCDLHPGNWLKELPVTNGTIFAYVMNNYWCTNYKAGQDGDFLFRYSLTSAKSLDPAQATLFGQDVQNPMRAIRLFAGRDSQNLPASKSFCSVEPADHVELTAAKPADDGRGLIFRVRETGGQAVDAQVVLDFPGASQAWRCDLVERDQESTLVNNGRLTVPLKAYGIATVRLSAK